MVADNNADYLMQLFVVVSPVKLVSDKPAYVIQDPVSHILLFIHLQLNVNDSS
jgi:hypothetical protein